LIGVPGAGEAAAEAGGELGGAGLTLAAAELAGTAGFALASAELVAGVDDTLAEPPQPASQQECQRQAE